jgi:hypothetical protein
LAGLCNVALIDWCAQVVWSADPWSHFFYPHPLAYMLQSACMGYMLLIVGVWSSHSIRTGIDFQHSSAAAPTATPESASAANAHSVLSKSLYSICAVSVLYGCVACALVFAFDLFHIFSSSLLLYMAVSW